MICRYCKDAVPVTRKPESILVHGAREHNLKNICFEIPKGKLVALTGLSGSGKSSIATNVLQNECVRQYLESLGMTTDHIEKAKVDMLMGLSPSIGVSQRVADFNPRSTVGTRTGILTLLRNMFAAMGHQPCNGCGKSVRFGSPHCGHPLEKLEMAHFSFNSVDGACKACKGIGDIIDIDIPQLLNEEKSIRNGGVTFWNEATAKHYEAVLIAASKYYNFVFDPATPIKNYTPDQKNFLLYGITFPDFAKAHKDMPAPKKVSEGNFEGLIPHIKRANIEKYILLTPCLECNSSGLGRIGRQTTINGKTIIDVVGLSLSELLRWLQELDQNLPQDELPIFRAFAGALKDRTSNLIEVGLHYLTLDRSLPSLSAGESQRTRLAALLGSGLTGVLYVLDEPTTGLHSHDTGKLLATLRKIQEAGNTVLVIEHDMDVVKQADYILDIGPRGGSQGGQVVATGTPAEVMASPASITGKYLAKKHTIKPHARTHGNRALTIRGAREHNLKNVTASIPIQQLVMLTGASGSGKSTFLFDIVDKVARKHFNDATAIPGKYDSVDGLEYFTRVVTVDQVTIGNTKSTRSNVATYTKLFDRIRDLFAALPAAKARGLDAEKFSFNTSDERCENCNGAGVVEVDMTFMPSVEQECPVCNGMRFNETILAVQFQGHHISSILNMTVADAMEIFRGEKKIYALLDIMKQVGLEYLKLGQSTSTLSGGEAQRIKLAAELSKSETGSTLYLLDEPTTGLHPYEVERLLEILKKLVSKGNTVVAIEHNLDAIANADTIIDFGPGGGSAGGTIVAAGTPQEIMANHNSITGQTLLESQRYSW